MSVYDVETMPDAMFYQALGTASVNMTTELLVRLCLSAWARHEAEMPEPKPRTIGMVPELGMPYGESLCKQCRKVHAEGGNCL